MNKTTTVQCGKCEGKGKLWFFSHRDNGVCTAGVSRRVGDDYTWSPAFRSELWVNVAGF